MKLQNPEWTTEPPEPLTDNAFWSLYSSAEGAAKHGRHRQDILEDFKWRFSNGNCKRSSCAKDAESDLYRLMKRATVNAPVFIATFPERALPDDHYVNEDIDKKNEELVAQVKRMRDQSEAAVQYHYNDTLVVVEKMPTTPWRPSRN